MRVSNYIFMFAVFVVLSVEARDNRLVRLLRGLYERDDIKSEIKYAEGFEGSFDGDFEPIEDENSLHNTMPLDKKDAGGNQPNIIIILADDLGYNDVGYHNPDVITPTIDKLVKKGIKLDNHYALPLCTPSRYAIMSGVYPFRAGMSHGVESAYVAHCAPMFYDFLPAYLKKVGYENIAVGKWHLGFCDEKCTPNARGFDKSYGYYNGFTRYYQHTSSGGGFDLHKDNVIEYETIGTHTMKLFSDYITKTIKEQDKAKPFFIYASFPSPHSPYEAEPKYMELYKDKDMPNSRKMFLSLVSSLDNSVKRIVDDLKEADLYDNTIIIFQSDNGGATFGPASNAPLRGTKLSLFEGGVKVPAFISSPLIKDSRVVTGITHTVDVPVTIMDLAGVDESEYQELDGVSFADVITKGTEPERTEFVLNIDLEEPKLAGQEALRSGKWKLIQGFAGLFTGYENNITLIQPKLPDHMVGYFKTTGVNTDVMEENKIILPDILLFNIEKDPEEHTNVAAENPDVVKNLQEKLDEYHTQYVKSFQGTIKPEGMPDQNEGSWKTGWCSVNENGIEN
ncbi:hypothetical protein A3Q56_03173 [Intoshia linei]|uniref:Sulfatase N-terminal domain-containing protein n=1 Tax=Intoshia linei TaxID=1819745 RepID=A0A177B4K7_9BILA|nr:hypothetical protein A3Q56_03173 [Intoshia linei]